MQGSRRRKTAASKLPPSSFRREAEAISLKTRSHLHIGLSERLCDRKLVGHLGLTTLPLSELATDCLDAVFSLVTHKGRTPAFSATAVCDATGPIGIVYNDAHETVRQRADIAHECAHLLLGHNPSTLRDEGGLRIYPEKEESEAHWLGPALLVPVDGLISYMRRDATLLGAAKHFDVSIELVRFRYNMNGCKNAVPLAA